MNLIYKKSDVPLIEINDRYATMCPNCEQLIFLPKDIKEQNGYISCKQEVRCVWNCGFKAIIKKSILKELETSY